MKSMKDRVLAEWEENLI